MTPTGIEPATFRFVAQRLNHCANAVPVVSVCTIYYWSGTCRSVMLAKNLTVISVVELWYHELVIDSTQVVCWDSCESLCCGSGPLYLYIQDLLDTTSTDPEFLNTVITGDESWV